MKKILFLFLLLTIIPLVSATTVDRLTPCDAQNACEEGLQCARLPAYETPVCVEDPCIEAGCTEMFQECLILESYPIQVMCTGPDIPWIPVILLITIALGIYTWKNKDKKTKKSKK